MCWRRRRGAEEVTASGDAWRRGGIHCDSVTQPRRDNYTDSLFALLCHSFRRGIYVAFFLYGIIAFAPKQLLPLSLLSNPHIESSSFQTTPLPQLAQLHYQVRSYLAQPLAWECLVTVYPSSATDRPSATSSCSLRNAIYTMSHRRPVSSRREPETAYHSVPHMECPPPRMENSQRRKPARAKRDAWREGNPCTLGNTAL